MELQRLCRPSWINIGQPRCLSHFDNLAIALVDAFEGWQQLVNGGEASHGLGQIDLQRPDPFCVTVGEIAYGVERASVRCAECQKRARIAPAIKLLEEIARYD